VTNGRNGSITAKASLPFNQTPEVMTRTHYVHKNEWNRHFGNNATIGKQYPTTTFSCSVHDVISMNDSRSIERTIEQSVIAKNNFKRKAMLDYMHRTASNIHRPNFSKGELAAKGQTS
jgi:hypothetical protein